jgi:leucyl-tRNA synthetase
VVPVPENQLPVTLPDDVSFDKPGNPLDHHPTWKHTTCPSCGGAAERETDTFDTFVESSWYFGRFCDPHNTERAFSREEAEKWLPVKQYVGGIEHAVLHLLYARFFTKALKMCGYWGLDEPFEGLFTQGMVCHKTYQRSDTKEWIYPQDVMWEQGEPSFNTLPVIVGRSEKMSKSKCNVVGVTPMVEAYGADAVRLFLLSDTPPARDMEWTEEGIEGAWRYVRRLWTLINDKVALCQKRADAIPTEMSSQGASLWNHVQQTTHKVTEALEAYELNKYIAYLRELSNAIGDFSPSSPGDEKILWESLRIFVQMAAPVIPHIAEEVGSLLDFSPGLHFQGWPVSDQTLLAQDTVKLSIQVNGKIRGHMTVPMDISQEDILQRITQEPTLQKYVAQGWKKAIIVPGRVVNLVI